MKNGGLDSCRDVPPAEPPAGSSEASYSVT